MKNWKKILLTSLVLGGTIATANITVAPRQVYAISTPHFITNEIKSEQTEVFITDSALDSAIRNLLGKSPTDKLFSNSFLTHEDYAPYEKEVDGSTITVANNYCLDFSRTGVKDITELVQFELPNTIKAINLAENGIDYDSANKIAEILKLDTSSPDIELSDQLSIAIKSDFTQIKKVNLCFNNISYDDITTLENNMQSHPNKDLFIYGVQNLNKLHATGLNEKKDMLDGYYYIKDTDAIYLSILITDEFNSQLQNSDENTPHKFADHDKLGKFSIKITSVPNSNESYFRDYVKELNFTIFECKIDENYKVERKSFFGIPEDKLILNGIYGDKKITYEDSTTENVGTYETSVYIKVGNTTREVEVEYTVVDTTKPTLELLGQKTMYVRLNRTFNDPKCLGWDSGDNITSRVMSNASEVLDVTKEGTYTITYTLKDLNNLSAVPVTRTVIVMENVLDKINLRVNSDDLYVGKEVLLEIKPDDGTPIHKYSNFKYSWYVDDILFITTEGDISAGKSTTPIKFTEKGEHKVYVVLSAMQGSEEIIITSETITLEIETASDENASLLIAITVAVLIIILSIFFVTLYKRNKQGGKTHSQIKRNNKSGKNTKKGKNSKKNSNPQPKKKTDTDIQVIKDYVPGDNKGQSTNKDISLSSDKEK